MRKINSVIARLQSNRGNPGFISGLLRRANGALLAMTIIAMTICTTVYAAEPIHTFTSSIDSQRFLSLTKAVRCPVCQGESIAESNAPLANDLRHKIYELMLANKSDAEIKTYLTSRYGKVILLQPPIEGATWLLWVFPFLAIACSLLFLLKKSRK